MFCCELIYFIFYDLFISTISSWNVFLSVCDLVNFNMPFEAVFFLVSFENKPFCLLNHHNSYPSDFFPLSTKIVPCVQFTICEISRQFILKFLLWPLWENVFLNRVILQKSIILNNVLIIHYIIIKLLNTILSSESRRGRVMRMRMTMYSPFKHKLI